MQKGLGVLTEPILRNRGEDTILRWLTALGNCTLLLGVALVAPGWSHADGLAQRKTTASVIATEGQTTERNWHAFWRYHLGTWQGSWTRYAASGDVKETFTSTRQFTANEAKTDIVQVNRYRYADGRAIEKKWSYNVKDHNRRDGFAHPASVDMRGLALDNGAAAWLIPSLQPNQVAPFELFLIDGDIRHSVGVLYGKNGNLIRTATIREQRGNTPNIGWTHAIRQVEPWHPVGRWEGQGRQINQDLSHVPVQHTAWQWMETLQSNHFFPDHIILRCPQRIIPGQAFSLQVIWMLNHNELQTITAKYDNNAHLVAITHQALAPEG